MSRTVDQVVAAFVAELREAMRDQLLASLAGWETATAPKPMREPVLRPIRRVGKAPRYTTSRIHRSPEAIRHAEDQVVAFVRLHPGTSSMAIRRATGLSVSQVGRALRAKGLIRKGMGQGATWSAGNGAT